MVPPDLAMVPPSGSVRWWYRQSGQWYHPDTVFQTVVPPSASATGCGTIRTQETQDETFLGSKFKQIEAYKYPSHPWLTYTKIESEKGRKHYCNLV